MKKKLNTFIIIIILFIISTYLDFQLYKRFQSSISSTSLSENHQRILNIYHDNYANSHGVVAKNNYNSENQYYSV